MLCPVLGPTKLARHDATSLQQFGHLLETFVVFEVLKQASWLAAVASSGHWRTHDGIEVDLVLDLDDGRIIAIQVKAGTKLAGEDLNGLKALRDELVAGPPCWAANRPCSQPSTGPGLRPATERPAGRSDNARIIPRRGPATDSHPLPVRHDETIDARWRGDCPLLVRGDGQRQPPERPTEYRARWVAKVDDRAVARVLAEGGTHAVLRLPDLV